MGALFGMIGAIAWTSSRGERTEMGRRLVHRGSYHISWSSPDAFLNSLCLAAPAVAASEYRIGERVILLDIEPVGSDGLTAAHAFVDGGLAALENGLPGSDWALASWNRQSKRLELARDRFGARPLYYSILPNRAGVAFATEYKALLAIDAIRAEIDPAMVWLLQQDKHLAPTRTLLADVQVVPPGEGLSFALDGSVVERRSLPPLKVAVDRHVTLPEAERRTREALLESVSDRVGSASQIGVALSGGIDSIAVACAVRKVAPACKLVTLTASDGPDDPERVTAELVASAIGSEHHSVDVAPMHIPDLLAELVWHLEDPIARTETIQFMTLAGAARGKADLVLTGAGSDGLFAGMPRHKVLWAMNIAPPGPARQALGEFYDFTQHGRAPTTLLGRVLAYAYFRGKLPSPPHVIGASVEFERSDFPPQGPEFLNHFLGGSYCSAVSRWLLKVEKPFAAASITHASPFVDQRLAETAFAIPARFKIRRGKEKYVLRRALASIIPPAVLNVPKAPMKMRHGGALGHVVLDLAARVLTRERIERRQLFAWPDIEVLRKRVAATPRTSETLMRLWTVLLTEIWATQFVDNRGARPTASISGP